MENRSTGTSQYQIKSALYGLLIGDAVGVPYEFNDAKTLAKLDTIDMVPPKNFQRSHAGELPGTWSDDGAQMLCLFASLKACGKFDIYDIADRFVAWYDRGYMAINHRVFDVGIQTSRSLHEYKLSKNPYTSGLVVENGRGNGSLMRVLPVGLHSEYSDQQLIDYSHQQSLITHGDAVPQICCALYSLWVSSIINGLSIKHAYEYAVNTLTEHYQSRDDFLYQLEERVRPLDYALTGKGGGYVIDSLRSVRDVLLNTDNYRDVIINSILLGDDTDTTAAIAGGIAGLYYGYDAIPQPWVDLLAGKGLVEELLV